MMSFTPISVPCSGPSVPAASWRRAASASWQTKARTVASRTASAASCRSASTVRASRDMAAQKSGVLRTASIRWGSTRTWRRIATGLGGMVRTTGPDASSPGRVKPSRIRCAARAAGRRRRCAELSVVGSGARRPPRRGVFRSYAGTCCRATPPRRSSRPAIRPWPSPAGPRP